MLKRLEPVDTLTYSTGPGGMAAALLGAALAGCAFAACLLAAPMLVNDELLRRIRGAWLINLCSTMAFGAALLLLTARSLWQGRQHRAFSLQVLREMTADETLLLKDDALRWRRELRELHPSQRDSLLVRLLSAALARSRADWSPQAAAAAIQEQAELAQCEMDSRYALIRYLTWAIPPIGFIGTVLGIGAAMGAMGAPANEGGQLMQSAAGFLHTAFDTTLVALVLSVTVMFFMFRIQARDDALIASVTDWCLRRYVYRMHVA